MNCASPKICLLLGRHGSVSSGLWVYSKTLLDTLCRFSATESDEKKEMLQDQSKEQTLLCLYSGEDPFRSEIQALGDTNPLKIETKEIPSILGSRRLGYIADIFYAPKNVKLIHGTANMIPVLGKCKKILTIHDLFQAYPPESPRSLYEIVRTLFYRAEMKFMLKKADRIIAVSEKTKEDILSRYGIKGRVEVIYPSLHTQYLISPLPSKRSVSKTFVAFASLDPRKNTSRILEAFSKFNSLQTEKYSLLLFANSGIALEKYKSEIKKLGIDEQVSFRISVPPKEMPSIYEASAGLVFPSLAEGFGYPIYEALSQGVPVLSSKNSILPGLTGLLGKGVIECECFSVSSIVEGMVNLSRFDLLVEERERVASEVRKTLDPSVTAQKVWNLYKEVLSEKN